MLVHRVANPLDTRIIADLLVGRVDTNHFVILHDSILVDPIGVQHTQIVVPTTYFLFRKTLQVPFEL